MFDRLRTLLRDELGTSPSPDTMAVYERLLRPGQRPPGERRRPSIPGAVPIELPSELVVRAAAPLVGRKRELERLQRLWSAARERERLQREDSGKVVLLAGDPGIGKTRLVAEIAQAAYDAGAFVLAGRSPEEALVPYQPFLEALRHYVLNVPFSELRASAREYGSELARLIPELRRRAPDLPPPVAAEPETERYRLFEAVVGPARRDVRAGARPARARRPPVGRSADAAAAPPPRASAEPGAAADPRRLPGDRGDRQRVHRRARGAAPRPARHDRSTSTAWPSTRPPSSCTCRPGRCRRARSHARCTPRPRATRSSSRRSSATSPRRAFAPTSPVRHELQQFGLPEGVKDVIARRLARLDPQAMEWLRVAAVIGRDFDADLLERVVSLDEDGFLNALDEALAAGLVVESPRRPGLYSFSHALIRETLYEGMSAPRRARIHRRVGEALEEQGTSRNLTALALHFTRAAGRAGCREGDRVRAPRRRAGDGDARARGGGRPLRPRARGPGAISPGGHGDAVRAAARARRGARARGRAAAGVGGLPRGGDPGRAARRQAPRSRAPRSAHRRGTSSRPGWSTRS